MRVIKDYIPKGSRNQGRPLLRLLIMWDQNGSTSISSPRYMMMMMKKNKKNYRNLNIMSIWHYVIALGAKYFIFCNPWYVMLLHSFSWHNTRSFSSCCVILSLQSKQIILGVLLFKQWTCSCSIVILYEYYYLCHLYLWRQVHCIQLLCSTFIKHEDIQ
jgi:hypothetical protein